MKDFYIDDGLTSVESAEDAIQLAREARELCATGDLRLNKFEQERGPREYTSSERATSVKDMDLAFDDLPLERALGIQWDVESDHFRFNVSLKEQPATRCGILSTVASVFDLLGLVAWVVMILSLTNFFYNGNSGEVIWLT